MISHKGVQYSKNSTAIHKRLSRKLPGQWVDEPTVSAGREYSSMVSYCNGIYKEYWCLDTRVATVYQPLRSTTARVTIYNPNTDLDPLARKTQMILGRAAHAMWALGHHNINVSKDGTGVTIFSGSPSSLIRISFKRSATLILSDKVVGLLQHSLLPYALIDDKPVELPSLPSNRVQRRRALTRADHGGPLYCSDGRNLWMSALEAGLPLQFDPRLRRFFAPWTEDQLSRLPPWQPGDPLPSTEGGLLDRPAPLETRQHESRRASGTPSPLVVLSEEAYPADYRLDFEDAQRRPRALP